MFLVILTNIHMLSVVGMLMSMFATVFGFIAVVTENKPWDEAVKKLPNNFFLASILTFGMFVALFCVTPSSFDVITMNLKG